MNDVFYRNGLRFQCAQCSACCRHDPGFVYLSERDLSALMKWSGLDREGFIARYCRWVSRGDGQEVLCLLEKPGYDCILWDGGCVAYEFRPLQCSTYPFWPSLLTDRDWWEANARECPGVNAGPLHGFEEIEACLGARRKEPYIKRPEKRRD